MVNSKFKEMDRLTLADIELISLTMKEDEIAIFNASKIAVSLGLGETFFQCLNEEPFDKAFQRMLNNYQTNIGKTNENESLLNVLRVLKIHSAYYTCSWIIPKLNTEYLKQCEHRYKNKFKIVKVQLNERDQFHCLIQFCTVCRTIGVTEKKLKSFTKLHGIICEDVIHALEQSKNIIQNNETFWGLVYWLGLKPELDQLSTGEDYMNSLIRTYAKLPDATVEKLIKTLLIFHCNEEADLVQQILEKFARKSKPRIDVNVSAEQKYQSWNSLIIKDYFNCHKHNEGFLRQLSEFANSLVMERRRHVDKMARKIGDILTSKESAAEKQKQLYQTLCLLGGTSSISWDKILIIILGFSYVQSCSNNYKQSDTQRAQAKMVECLRMSDFHSCESEVEEMDFTTLPR